MKDRHTEEDVLAASLKKSGRDSRIETVRSKPSWQKVNPMNVRSRYMVQDLKGTSVARCRKCNVIRGRWPEGGLYPETIFGPCPHCEHDPMLLPWPMVEPLS